MKALGYTAAMLPDNLRLSAVWQSTSASIRQSVLAAPGRAGLFVLLTTVAAPTASQQANVPAPPGANWGSYAADVRSTKYSPLDQIDASNVAQLEVAWRWKSIEYGAANKYRRLRPASALQTTPLKVEGALLFSTGMGVAAAADPGTGEMLWYYDGWEGTDGPPIGLGGSRAGATWERGEKRRLFFFVGPHLTSLDLETGKVDPEFGEGGKVDLRVHTPEDVRRNYRWSSAPLVCGDTLVMGNSERDAWSMQKNPPGTIRGYSAETGQRLWTFYIIPRKGEFGYDTWEDGSADYTGAANVWTWMSCDPDMGRVFAATSTPSNDWYGGHRKGKGLFAESILALDLESGERAWHFQAVHHGIWDYDFPAAPVLADIEVDGRPIQAVAVPSKQAFLYVFDRATGEPVWPIVELPVLQSNVDGEESWPTQPVPTWPKAYDLQGLSHNDLIDFTPELRRMALDYVAQFRIGPMFMPPELIEGVEAAKPSIQSPGPVGGTNWNGVGLDPETNILYVPSVTAPAVMGLRPPPDPARSDLKYRVDLSEADGYLWTMLPNGLPITKPPYGRITAIDLDTGEHVWMVPNGEGPRDHPDLAGLDLPRLGQPARVSPLVTKTLLFVAEGTSTMPVQPWGGGPMFRAYDKATGEIVWEMELPTPVSGAPMTYLHEGKQYIVMPVSEEGHENALLALALPD